jgi:hypothetical protein
VCLSWRSLLPVDSWLAVHDVVCSPAALSFLSSLGARVSEGGEPRLRLVLHRRAAPHAGCGVVGPGGLGARELKAHVVE